MGLKREGTASVAENPASQKGKAWLLACGLFLGVVIALAGRHTLDYTRATHSATQACHSHPHATQMWLQSAHYSNKRGVVTHCTDCHLPPGGFQYLTEKARLGMHDAYAQIFRDVSKIEWSRERQLERAPNVLLRFSVRSLPQQLVQPGAFQMWPARCRRLAADKPGASARNANRRAAAWRRIFTISATVKSCAASTATCLRDIAFQRRPGPGTAVSETCDSP